jgi:hypothetical protein
MGPCRAPATCLLLVTGWASVLVGCGETKISITDPVQERLLLYLPLDETEVGAVAVDTSGNGHDGTPSADPPTPSVSVPPTGFPNGRSLSFSGTNQFLDLGNPPGLDIEGPVTISAWVRLLSHDGFRNIVAHGWTHEPNHELALRVQGPGAVPGEPGVPSPVYEFVTWDGANHSALAPIPEGDLDAWHHLCGVYDGARYRLFRDGQLLAEQADPVAPMRVEQAWSIGARGMPGGFDPRYLRGMVDEVRIYGRALSDAEVRALFRR